VTARIVLVRHGPSSFNVGGVLDWRGVERWRDYYDAAGIQIDARPPASLVHMAREATHLIASDMPRAWRRPGARSRDSGIRVVREAARHSALADSAATCGVGAFIRGVSSGSRAALTRRNRIRFVRSCE
jgi:hypothetical protein